MIFCVKSKNSHDREKEGSDKKQKNIFSHIWRVLNKMYAKVFTTSDLTMVLNCRHFKTYSFYFLK